MRRVQEGDTQSIKLQILSFKRYLSRRATVTQGARGQTGGDMETIVSRYRVVFFYWPPLKS